MDTNKRNGVIVSILIGFVILLFATSFILLNSGSQAVNDRVADPEQIVVTSPKDPSKDVFARDNMPLAPAPSGPAETVAPMGSVSVDRDLMGLEGLTGTSYYWDDQIGIEITPQGYQNLLIRLDLDPSNPPATLYLSERTANSIGYSSDNPEMRYMLVRE